MQAFVLFLTARTTQPACLFDARVIIFLKCFFFLGGGGGVGGLVCVCLCLICLRTCGRTALVRERESERDRDRKTKRERKRERERGNNPIQFVQMRALNNFICHQSHLNRNKCKATLTRNKTHKRLKVNTFFYLFVFV